MRFADGPTVEVDTYVEAPPSRVWALVRDIDLPSRFSEEFQGAAWLDGATEAVTGAKFTGRNRHEAIGEWATTAVVVTCEAERAFEWAVGDPENASASWRFELEPKDAGTLLRQRATLGPGPSGLTHAIAQRPDKEERIIERRLEEHRANMQRTVDGIKSLAEGAS